MKFLEELKTPDYDVVMGIDASSRHIGISVLKSSYIISLAAIDLSEATIYERMKDLRLKISVLIDHYHPEFVMIESPIMVQNPLTTKNLSYIAGIIIALFVDRNIPIEEVGPMTWKSWVGYKRLTPKIKEEIIESLGKTAGNKEINHQKKHQVQMILQKRYPQWAKTLENDNLADALGIALFAEAQLEERKGEKVI